MQVAIDSAGGELYWTDFTGTVSRASVVSTCASTEDAELNRVACVCGEDVSGESARLAATSQLAGIVAVASPFWLYKFGWTTFAVPMYFSVF